MHLEEPENRFQQFLFLKPQIYFHNSGLAYVG